MCVYMCVCSVYACVNASCDFKHKGEKIMERNQASGILCGKLHTLRDCIGRMILENGSS